MIFPSILSLNFLDSIVLCTFYVKSPYISFIDSGNVSMMSRIAPITLDDTEEHSSIRAVSITIDLCNSSSDEHSDDSSSQLSSSSSDESLLWEGDWVTGRFVSSRFDDCNVEQSVYDGSGTIHG